MQPELSLILGRRREHVGVDHRTHLVANVVVHPVGIDVPAPLLEDDVPFHVDFQGNVGRLEGPVAEIGLLRAGGPDHHPIGGDVDRAQVGQPVDDQHHTRVEDPDPLVGAGIERPLELDRGDPAARKGPNPPARRSGVFRRPPEPGGSAARPPLRRGIAAGQAVLINGGQYVRPSAHRARMNLDRRAGREAAQPVVVVNLGLGQALGQIQNDLAFQVRDHLARLLAGCVGTEDPQHRFLAVGRSHPLANPAIAP